ncbi:MAG: ABC transporter permease [Anaerolineales bacterium]
MGTIKSIWRLAVASAKQILRSKEVFATMILFPGSLLFVLALFSNLQWETEAGSIQFMDHWITGLGVLGVALGNGHAFLSTISNYKAGGVLKRISVTPVSPAQLILGEVLPRGLMGILTITGFFAIGRALGANVRVDPGVLAVLPVMVIVTATGLSIAFVIAGLTKTPQNANALDSAISFPLYLFTGAMFPLAAFPDWLENLARYIPYTGLLSAVRGIIIHGQALGDFGPELTISLIWMAVLFAAAARAYRFVR